MKTNTVLVTALLGLLGSAACAEESAWKLLPEDPIAAQPSVVANGQGVFATWIEHRADGHRLRLGEWTGSGLSKVETIAEGSNWFVNWADFPSLQLFDDGRQLSFVLEKRPGSPYAYGIKLLSRDGAGTPWRNHELHDASATEHGFVAMWPWKDSLGIAWLDGRAGAEASSEGGTGHGGHGGAAMSLRAAKFDGKDASTHQWPLDLRTCDCCQTDAAMTSDGPVVVYRDRSEHEIRDIAIVRWEGASWSAPQAVHVDNWLMPGCPVNGPAVSAQEQQVWVAWYSGAGGPRVQLAHSSDAGRSFSAPLLIAEGEHVLGRVDLASDAQGNVMLSWISERQGQQQLELSQIMADGTRTDRSLASIGRGHGTGFPRIALHDDSLHLIWTDTREPKPKVRGMRLALSSKD